MGFPVAAVAGIIPSIGGIIGGNSKDPGRFAKNLRWYGEALTGKRAALDALKYMSGQYGPNPAPIPGYCDDAGSCSGWGSTPAKNDAHQKYQSALDALQKGGQILTALGGQAVKTGTEAQATALASKLGLSDVPTWVLLLGAAGIAWLIWKGLA